MSAPADRRSVSTDALETLGSIIGPSEKRDAVHIAVEPVIAGEALSPGERIYVVGGVATGARSSRVVGIVDPFLAQAVEKGERFWCLLLPRQISSLRHVWTHPAFPDEGPTLRDVAAERFAAYAQSEAFVLSLASKLGITSAQLLEYAEAWVRHGHTVVLGGVGEWEEIPDDFWPHFEVLTGTKVPQDQRESFLRCCA